MTFSANAIKTTFLKTLLINAINSLDGTHANQLYDIGYNWTDICCKFLRFNSNVSYIYTTNNEHAPKQQKFQYPCTKHVIVFEIATYTIINLPLHQVQPQFP